MFERDRISKGGEGSGGQKRERDFARFSCMKVIYHFLMFCSFVCLKLLVLLAFFGGDFNGGVHCYTIIVLRHMIPPYMILFVQSGRVKDG